MKKPLAIETLESRQLRIKGTGEHLSSAKSLSDAFGIQSLLVHQEELLPGHRASRPHYHTRKDEIFIVISGRPSIWCDGVETQLNPGECIGFSSDSTIARMIVNRSDEQAVIMTIGSNPSDDQVCYVEESDFNLGRAV